MTREQEAHKQTSDRISTGSRLVVFPTTTTVLGLALLAEVWQHLWAMLRNWSGRSVHSTVTLDISNQLKHGVWDYIGKFIISKVQ